jgi:hypothetical protein
MSIHAQNILLVFSHRTLQKSKRVGKALPIIGRVGPYCCEMSRVTHVLESRV